MKERLKRRVLMLAISFVLGITFTSGGGMALADDNGADEMSGDSGDQCKRVPADVPDALKVPAGQCLKEQVVGIGVQIYVCTSGSLVFKAPEANLTKHGRFVGNHFLGPKWEWIDGSKVGTAPNPVKVPAPNPIGDIPWLLLTVASNDGAGKLFDVTFVQRLHTSGGVAPAGACAPEASEIRVPYTADYLFYHPKN